MLMTNGKRALGPCQEASYFYFYVNMKHMKASSLLKIPDKVRKEAQKGNQLVKDGYSGGTPTGWARGEQLAAGGRIPMADAMVMRAWFARHYATSRPNYVKWLTSTRAQRQKKTQWHGAVAWLIWGGDPAYEWILSEGVQKAIVAWGKRQGKQLVSFVQPQPLYRSSAFPLALSSPALKAGAVTGRCL